VLVEDKLGMEVASEGVVLHVGRGMYIAAVLGLECERPSS
jgi:hypothetical protein